jgi:hypothetical protein
LTDLSVRDGSYYRVADLGEPSTSFSELRRTGAGYGDSSIVPPVIMPTVMTPTAVTPTVTIPIVITPTVVIPTVV